MFFFFKQKTAYEMRISDWSSDVCSSDLAAVLAGAQQMFGEAGAGGRDLGDGDRDVDLRRGGIGGVDDERARHVAEDAGLFAEAEMNALTQVHSVAGVGGVRACGEARCIGRDGGGATRRAEEGGGGGGGGGGEGRGGKG